jgi:hypothetical protein
VQAKADQRYVFFMDAAHFVFAPFSGYLWCFARLFIKAPSRRKRFNVLGALNAISHQMVVITNTDYINSYSVCSLLIKLSQKYGDLPILIRLQKLFHNASQKLAAIIRRN